MAHCYDLHLTNSFFTRVMDYLTPWFGKGVEKSSSRGNEKGRHREGSPSLLIRKLSNIIINMSTETTEQKNMLTEGNKEPVLLLTEGNKTVTKLVSPAKLQYPYAPIIGAELTVKQDMFCRFYTDPMSPDTVLNMTNSYAAAYGYDFDSYSREYPTDATGKIIGKSEWERAQNSCAANASALIRNNKIKERINDLYSEMMNDVSVDRELVRIIFHAPKASDRISAIKEYNALKQRITKKLDLTTKGESLNSEDKNKINNALSKVLSAPETK